MSGGPCPRTHFSRHCHWHCSDERAERPPQERPRRTGQRPRGRPGSGRARAPGGARRWRLAVARAAPSPLQWGR
eukprot:4068906-Prymnesium_polylepis.1